MGFAVTFVYADWAAAYPQFSNVTEQEITGTVLPIAELYQRNDGGGPISSEATAQALLWLMVAHVAQLLYGSTQQPLSGLVGVITDATEGSVNVKANFPITPNNAWFMQTRYGAAWWQATAAYRTMRYIIAPQRRMNPWANQ